MMRLSLKGISCDSLTKQRWRCCLESPPASLPMVRGASDVVEALK
jgi:hypothetical protein